MKMGNSTKESIKPKPNESVCDPDSQYKPELVQVKTIVQPTDVEIVDIDPSEMKPSRCLPCHVPRTKTKPETHEGNADEGSAVDSLFNTHGRHSEVDSSVESLFVNQVTREAVRGSMKISLGPNSEMVQRTGKSGVNTRHNDVELVKRTGKGGDNTHDDGEEFVKRTADKASEWTTRQLKKLPAWMRENEYLQFGHRPQLNSYKECFKSIFKIHTETVNIWTHMIGMISFVFIAIHFYAKPLCDDCEEDISLLEKLIFLVYFIGAFLCLGLSTLFHIVACHSPQIYDLFARFDYAGIAIQTLGSFIPAIYYGFYCDFSAQVGYLTAVSVLSLAAIILAVHPSSVTPQYRPLRIASFVCLGCFGFVPLLHCVYTSGWSQAVMELSLGKIALMAFFYLAGTALYGARIPERFVPGKCDIWFHSHQIFHVCVVAAAVVHYSAIVDMAVYRHMQGKGCTSPGTSQG